MFADRISGFTESIFTTMSKLAFEKNAINLGQGFPDFDGYKEIFEFAHVAMLQGKNQYAPSSGIKSLRDVISVVNQSQYGLSYNPDTEITITTGATEAIFDAMQAFINPEDEVILFEPYYDAHLADVLLAGGTPKFVTLHKPDFHFDKDELIDKITDKTKMLVLNTPHNPLGKVFNYEELSFIADLAIENDFLVLTDEVYEFLTYDGIQHLPLAKLDGMHARTITISSTGKTFGSTGWKVGYVCANSKLTEAIRKVHQWTTFAVHTPAQHAMAEAFTRFSDYLPEFKQLYQNKRDILYNALKGSEFNPTLPLGSYFMMVDVPKNFTDDVDAALKLVNDYAVATIPPSAFYSVSDEGKSMLRLCFAKKDETLIEGAKRLLEAINE